LTWPAPKARCVIENVTSGIRHCTYVSGDVAICDVSAPWTGRPGMMTMMGSLGWLWLLVNDSITPSKLAIGNGRGVLSHADVMGCESKARRIRWCRCHGIVDANNAMRLVLGTGMIDSN
jgi:hypothetical protein